MLLKLGLAIASSITLENSPFFQCLISKSLTQSESLFGRPLYILQCFSGIWHKSNYSITWNTILAILPCHFPLCLELCQYRYLVKLLLWTEGQFAQSKKFMNTNSYLSHIHCVVKYCDPRVCSVTVVQLACVSRIEYFSRNLILYRNYSMSHYWMIFPGVCAPHSTKSLTLLDYLEAILLDVFTCL